MSTSFALGATLVMELLKRRPEAVRTVYISPSSRLEEVEQAVNALGAPVVRGEKAFNILSPKGNCYVIAEFEKFAPGMGDGHHAVLVNPSDSGNLGTIMRTVAAFDCFDLAIIRPAVDPFDPKTVRAAMGAIFDIGFKEFDSFDDYLREFPKRTVVPFMLGGAPLSCAKFSADEKYSLVFGNEASGLPYEFEKYGALKIEQSQSVDSLNLSVAAAIAMYSLKTALAPR